MTDTSLAKQYFITLSKAALTCTNKYSAQPINLDCSVKTTVDSYPSQEQ